MEAVKPSDVQSLVIEPAFVSDSALPQLGLYLMLQDSTPWRQNSLWRRVRRRRERIEPWRCCEPRPRATSDRSSSPSGSCCARRKWPTYPDWAELRAAEPRLSHALGAGLGPDELSRASFRRRVRHYLRDLREDVGYALFIFAKDSERSVGGMTLCNVRRGVTQSCTLGYWIGASLRPPGLHDGGGQRRCPIRIRFARAAPASKLPVYPATSPR